MGSAPLRFTYITYSGEGNCQICTLLEPVVNAAFRGIFSLLTITLCQYMTYIQWHVVHLTTLSVAQTE